MITRRDLDEAIDELETKSPSMEGCIRLAALYTVREHLYGDVGQYGAPSPSGAVESIIGDHGDSEFLQVIAGKDAGDVWAVIDETMATLKLMEPRLYAGVLRKIDK